MGSGFYAYQLSQETLKMVDNITNCNISFDAALQILNNFFKTKDLSAQIGSSRLSFATPEFMEKFLDIKPGAVSVLGLMNDKENNVRLLIDADVLRGEYFGCHPCVNTSSLKIKTNDLIKTVLPAVNHEYSVVEL